MVATEPPTGTLIGMDRDEAIADLRRVRRQRDRAESARTAAARATRAAIIAALQADIGPTEIASECGVTDSHVRAVRRAAKLPANPSYAALKPPVRTKAPVEPIAVESAAHQVSVPSEADLPDYIRNLTPPVAKTIVDRIRKAYPSWHEEAQALVADAPARLQNLLIIYMALDAKILEDSGFTPVG